MTRPLIILALLGATLGATWRSARAAEEAPAAPYASWKNGPSPDPSYFPIGVWLQSPAQAERYKKAGVEPLHRALSRPDGKGPGPAQGRRHAGVLLAERRRDAALGRPDDRRLAPAGRAGQRPGGPRPRHRPAGLWPAGQAGGGPPPVPEGEGRRPHAAGPAATSARASPTRSGRAAARRASPRTTRSTSRPPTSSASTSTRSPTWTRPAAARCSCRWSGRGWTGW